MKTPKYICSKCRQPFTRRWNANRHCNNKHYGTLDCVFLFTEYLVNTGNTKFLRLPDKYSEHTFQIPSQQNLFQPEKTNPMLQTIFKTSLDPIKDDDDKMILLYSKLDQLASQVPTIRKSSYSSISTKEGVLTWVYFKYGTRL